MGHISSLIPVHVLPCGAMVCLTLLSVVASQLKTYSLKMLFSRMQEHQHNPLLLYLHPTCNWFYSLIDINVQPYPGVAQGDLLAVVVKLNLVASKVHKDFSCFCHWWKWKMGPRFNRRQIGNSNCCCRWQCFSSYLAGWPCPGTSQAWSIVFCRSQLFWGFLDGILVSFFKTQFVLCYCSRYVGIFVAWMISWMW